jgi:hypothetical protein
MISICTAATKSYLYAWPQLIRAIATAAAHHEEAHFIFSSDQSDESKKATDYAKSRLPEGWKVTTINLPITEDSKDYKEAAQIRIAQLQGEAFAFARRIKSDLCWSVESDTIPTADALRVLEWALKMPDAVGNPYYHVAAGTYPNGLFLGGHGSHDEHIYEDFKPHERKIKPRLLLLLEKTEERLKSTKDRKSAEKELKRMVRLRELVKKCPPDGNIWEVTARYGWRKRGWLDFAYPAIGLGSIVPSDWCGLGCTLMSKHALALSDFSSYSGHGTQDLHLCYKRWKPAGIRIACVPHVVCDHIKHRERDGKSEIVHHVAWHDLNENTFGHLRQREQPFVPV